MYNKLSNQEKSDIVAAYGNGQTVASLCIQHNIPRSTIYLWIKRHQTLRSSTPTSVSYNDYYNLKRRTDKLDELLKVTKAAGCGTSAPLQEKLAALEKLHGQFSVHALCEALGVARGTFYNHIFRRKDVTYYDKRREDMREHIKTVFDESRQRYGADKVCAVLANRNIRTTPKYVATLMREMGLYSIRKNSKREHKKKISYAKKRNHLQRQFNTTAPNLVWVSDVTCFKVKEQYFYLCVIIDLFSRKVVSYKVSKSNSTYLITSTFRKAFETRSFPKKLIFHSDRGVQYTSKTFRKLLSVNKVVQSFSNSGKPHDNAVAEAFFSSLKTEELYRTNYRSEREFRQSVEDYILSYNTQRPHRTLAYRTPERFEQEHSNKKNPV